MTIFTELNCYLSFRLLHYYCTVQNYGSRCLFGGCQYVCLSQITTNQHAEYVGLVSEMAAAL